MADRRRSRSRSPAAGRPAPGSGAGSEDPAGRLESRLTPAAERVVVLALLAVAAGIRALYYFEIGDHVDKSGDAEIFLALARRIAAGDVFLAGDTLVFSPLYYYFLGTLFAIFGESYRIVLAVQLALGVGAGWVLHRFARDVFGPLAALLALALYVFYGLIVFYEGQLMDASFSVLLSILALWLLRRATVLPGWRPWLPAGVALGLLALTRPNVMLFFPLAFGWALWFGRSARAASANVARAEALRAARSILPAAALTVGIGLCIFPFTIRNWLTTGDVTLVTSHGGVNFYIGNHDRATGFFSPPPGFPPLPGVLNREIPRRMAEGETGRTGMSDSEVSSYWFARGLAFIAERPARFAALTLRKTRAFFNGYEVPVNIDFRFAREIYPSLRLAAVPIGLVLPLALLGLAASRRRWRELLPFHLFLGAYSISVILFFVTARYRLPIVPLLIVYAGFALRTLLASVEVPKRLAVQLVGVAALGLALNADLGLRFDEALVAHSRGYTLEMMERKDEAIAYYEEALRENPDLLLTRLRVARLYGRRGSYAEARRHFDAARRLAPNDPAVQDEWRRFDAYVRGLEGR